MLFRSKSDGKRCQAFVAKNGNHEFCHNHQPDVIAQKALKSIPEISLQRQTGIAELSDVHLCANWMAAAGEPGEDAALYETVRAVTTELCPALGISIPVGKDSMSMSSQWREGGRAFSVSSPLSLIVTAFARVADVRRSVTPELSREDDTVLVLVDLARGHLRLGGSALAQVFGQVGDEAPDLDYPEDLRAFFAATRALLAMDILLAYHDRSDGGLIVTLLEMAFASRCSLKIDLGQASDPLASLFAEELGAVLQVRRAELEAAKEVLSAAGLGEWVYEIGAPATGGDSIQVIAGGETLLDTSRSGLHQIWSELTAKM